MLQEEATLIAEKLEISNFVASNGRLEKFKQKYSICNKTVAGEVGDVSKETMESWNERAREITTGWNARDVSNTDETGCFWRGLPEKSLDAKGSLCTGGKKAKQRLTWAFFVNAEEDKEDPVVIGTSVSPRCFKNLQSPSRTVFKHHRSVFGKKHHFQITATGCRYNRQLEGPLQKANAAVPWFALKLMMRKTRPKSSNPSTFLWPLNGGDKPGTNEARSAFRRLVCIHVMNQSMTTPLKERNLPTWKL